MQDIDNIELISKLSKEELVKVLQTALIVKTSPSQNIQVTQSTENTDIQQQSNSTINDSTSNQNISIITSPIKQVTEEILPFELPVDNIINKLNQIQNLVSLIGNKDKKLKNWYNSLISISDNFINDLNLDKDKLNTEFIKSLETITKIFSITSKFSPIEAINESVLTPTIRNLIMDYKSNNFTNLEDYCSDNLSMYTLNKDIEENLIRLIPILSQQLLAFNKQLKKFYSLYELVDDYNSLDDAFINKIPTKSDIQLFNEINEATDIKLILQTNFNQINPELVSQLDLEIANLNKYILQKISSIRNLIIEVINLNHELFRENDDQYLHFPHYLNESDDSIIHHIGLKSSTLKEYQDILDGLKNLKKERQTLLDNYLVQVEQLWSILRPDSNEIQNFLKQNKNLYVDSLKNFQNLLIELDNEKLANIKQFIYSSRLKIKGFWDILMYDEESRLKFQEYYINDEQLFDENLLDSHTTESERLRNETENLKPLLNLISDLNGLLEEKRQLDESSKDPSRLLKRNSFKILRQEERIRDKLTKQFPIIIKEIRFKIHEFETENGRIFKLNGESYLDKLEEIEDITKHGRRAHSKSSFKSPISSASSRKRVTSTKPPKSRVLRPDISTRNTRNPKTPLQTYSVIRKRDPNQMTNPFLSKNPTPLKAQNKINRNNGVSSSRPDTPQSLSTEPIILRGRSPVKSTLNFNGSTKVSSFPNLTSSTTRTNNSSTFSLRSPMGLINRNNDNIINNKKNSTTILSSSKLDSIPVEELSDSFIEYSDNENDHPNKATVKPKNDKENVNPVTLNNITKVLGGQQTKHYNLSLDSETF